MTKHLFIGLGSLAIALSAHAVVYSDADSFGVTLAVGSPAVTGNFNFINMADGSTSFAIGAPYLPEQLRQTYASADGFDPVRQDVVPGTGAFIFFFRDPDLTGVTNAVTVTIGSPSDPLQGVVGQTFQNQFVFSKNMTGVIEGQISDTGILSYSVFNSGESPFVFDAAFARIEATAVPDGGSAVALLGVALVGIEGLRRKVLR
jgi:hypothetical protein